jgi:23S rRNA pseudouridine2605 synthase
VEEYITSGRISVNGEIVTELATVVDPEKDEVLLNRKSLTLGSGNIHILLNKPSGYLTTVRDDFGRPTVMDLVKGLPGRLFPVGRLDLDSSGLVLLTNDGELAYRLSHPKYEIAKTYVVKVEGVPEAGDLERLREGIELPEGKTSPARIEVRESTKSHTTVVVEIHEGKKRQIRKMFAAIGCPVVELERVGLGTLQLGTLEKGAWRELTESEIVGLKGLLEPKK